jgi:hypothetical protein
MMNKDDHEKKGRLTAKQKFHEDMVLGSKFIQDWYLFPTVAVDGIEFAYGRFLRSFVLFLQRPIFALEIQDLGISLFGASRYPCFDNILEFEQSGFYGVIDQIARIDRLTGKETELFIKSIKNQHHRYEIRKPIKVLKIAAASGEFYVNLSDIKTSFKVLLGDKMRQNNKANSVLDNLDLNRVILDREIFSAMSFIDGYDDMLEYYGLDEDDPLGEDEDFERPNGEAKDKPGNLGRPNIDVQKPTTLEMDSSKKKDTGSDGSKKNNKPKGGPKDGKKRKKKP